MVRKIRKASAFLLALGLIVGALAACGGGNKNEPKASGMSPSSASPTTPSSTESSSPSDSAAAAGGKFDPPVTFNVIACTSDVKWRSGESLEDNVHTRWMKDKMGIELKFMWTAPLKDSACGNKIKLEIASGNTLPDFIGTWDPVEFKALAETGQFMDVSEVYQKYASGTYKNAVESYQNVWDRWTIDGKHYALPFFSTAMQNDPVLWIRKDWMDKLGLQPPKSFAELEAMMEAFKTKDPDGNKKNDTVPLALGLKEMYANMMGDATWIFGAYGTMTGAGKPGGWWLERDGKLVNGDVQPEAKQALAKIKEWMDKGYIDKEAGLHNTFDAGKLFTSSKAAIIPAAYWTPRWPFSTDFVDKNAKYEAFAIPPGPDGKSGRYSEPSNNFGLLINKDFKHVDALFTYINRLYEFADPKPGSEFEFGFAEGYDYVKKADGTVSNDPKDLPSPDESDPVMLGGIIPKPQLPETEMSLYSKLQQGYQPATPKEKYFAQDKVVAKAGAMLYDTKSASIINAFQGAPTETMTSRGENLKKLVMEYYAKIVYGKIPLDDFDKMVEEYKKQGGDQLEKEVNDWYQSVRK